MGYRPCRTSPPTVMLVPISPSMSVTAFPAGAVLSFFAAIINSVTCWPALLYRPSALPMLNQPSLLLPLHLLPRVPLRLQPLCSRLSARIFVSRISGVVGLIVMWT